MNVRIGESEWELWPTAMVRGSGFPAAAVKRLADENLAALADRAADGDRDEFDRAWPGSAENLSRELGLVAASERFQLAVGWQNARFLRTAVEPFLRQRAAGQPSTAKRRDRELAIAMYWQRYCLKNESIGFFGPTAWASVGRHARGIEMDPGPCLTDKATVYIERWAVDTVARSLSEEFDLRPWLFPRRAPTVRLQPGAVIQADGTTAELDAMAEAALIAADGTTTARDIARALVNRIDLPVADEAGAFVVLENLRRRRWLTWRLELPVSLTAEDDLSALAARIDDADVRMEVTRRVDVLRAGRRRLQRVWDRPAELRAEMERLDRDFHQVTGVSAVRHAGRAYGGRTLAFVECRRDVDVRIGTEFVDALRPLTGVLDSIRWVTWDIRRRLEPVVRDAYRAAQARAEGTDVTVATLWMSCMSLLGRQLDAAFTESIAEFHRRWRVVLDLPADAGRVDLTSTELETALKEQFDAPAPGWSQARMACPDVMVVTNGVDGLRQGRYTIVLGEVHAAMNSMDYISLVPLHNDPADLHAGLDATFPAGRLLPVLPTESRPPFTARSHPALISDRDHRLAVMPHTPLPRTGRVNLAADMTVRDDGDRLVVLPPSGTAVFDVFDLFAEVFKALMLQHFGLFPVEEHRPRISVDGAVLAREGWRVAASDLTFATRAGAAERFIEARRWAAGLGLPRYVFVKSPVETKPFYVDFASPVFTELLASSVRRLLREGRGEHRTLTIVEMMPSPDELWLGDDDGNRYTAELRFAATDRRTIEGTP